MSEVAPTTSKPIMIAAMRHSGTHLIQPIIRIMTGMPVYIPKGEVSLTAVPPRHLIVWFRDPRNWLVSCFKWKHGAEIHAGVDEQLATFMTARRKARSFVSFVDEWSKRWAPAASEKKVLSLRFEQFIGPDYPTNEALVAIGSWVSASPDLLASWRDTRLSFDEVWRRVHNKSGTATGRPSRWQDWFGPAASKAWAAAGGDRIVERMGYGP